MIRKPKKITKSVKKAPRVRNPENESDKYRSWGVSELNKMNSYLDPSDKLLIKSTEVTDNEIRKFLTKYIRIIQDENITNLWK